MDETERVYRVALLGVVGSGKSSIINLLADKQVADISINIEPCTRRARWYPISLGGRTFRLWDTMGFQPAEERKLRLWDTTDFNPVGMKAIDWLSPYEQAHALLRNLPRGIDLILLCARKDGINVSLRRLYWLLDSFFFGGRAQIALVLTHFDTLSEQLEWWDRSRDSIAQKCNIPVHFIPHACITAVHHGSQQSDPLCQRSKQALEMLLKNIDDTNTTPFPLDFPSTAAAESLMTHCQLSGAGATRLVERFKLPKRHFNVILFGESNTGKSSIINLLTGHPMADVSAFINTCTLDFSCYEVDIGSHQLRVWDTVGFGGTHTTEKDIIWKAIENAVRLIRSLCNEGGVDLLVFCRKSGRCTSSELHGFKLFREFLCEGRIPVAFIITNLEYINPMEKWWKDNEAGLLETFGLKPDAIAGHACVTSLSLKDANDQTLRDKILLSRQLIQTMLGDAISYGDAPGKVIGGARSSRKMTVKNLMERCGLSKEHAEALITMYRKA